MLAILSFQGRNTAGKIFLAVSCACTSAGVRQDWLPRGRGEGRENTLGIPLYRAKLLVHVAHDWGQADHTSPEPQMCQLYLKIPDFQPRPSSTCKTGVVPSYWLPVLLPVLPASSYPLLPFSRYSKWLSFCSHGQARFCHLLHLSKKGKQS